MGGINFVEVFERRALRAEAINADLLAALKAVEWVGKSDSFSCWSECAECQNERRAGHAPDCVVGNAIARAEGRQP